MEVDCSPQDHHCQFLKVFSDFYETKTRKESRANEGRRYSIRKIHTSVSVIFIRTCLAKAMLWFIDLCQGWIANIYIVLSGLGLCDVLIDVFLLQHCSWCTVVWPSQRFGCSSKTSSCNKERKVQRSGAAEISLHLARKLDSLFAGY